MSGRRLVLLRHGRTAYNHRARIQGQTDVPLDEVGLAQAARTAPAVAALGPDLLWCSDLTRTRQTAAPLAQDSGLRPSYDERLREFHLGEREGVTHQDYEAIDAVEFAEFRRGNYDAALGAEKTAEVRRRMTTALQELLVALPPGGTGVAVSHGAAIRVATAALLGWPEDQYLSLRGLENCGWAVLVEDVAGEALRLQAYNRVAPTP